MRPKLAAGVTLDFIHAASSSEKLGTYFVAPLFFVCSLLTTVPRVREGALTKGTPQGRSDVAGALGR